MRGRLAKRQRGQAMLEYALITGTVVVGFAAASQLGVSQLWAEKIDQPRDTYFITLHFNCPSGLADCAGGIADSIDAINNQIATR
jgi:Flp pilus assembly pilin Flp